MIVYIVQRQASGNEEEAELVKNWEKERVGVEPIYYACTYALNVQNTFDTIIFEEKHNALMSSGLLNCPSCYGY